MAHFPLIPPVSAALQSSSSTAFDWASLIVGAIGSVGTVLALVWAVRVARREHQDSRREAERRSEEERVRDERRRRQQAESVAAVGGIRWDQSWTGGGQTIAGPSGFSVPVPSVPKGEEIAEATVHNASPLPIYEITIELRTGTTVERISMIPPGGMRSVDLPTIVPNSVDGNGLGVRFRDAAGLWWRRHPDGVLDEIVGGNPQN